MAGDTRLVNQQVAVPPFNVPGRSEGFTTMTRLCVGNLSSDVTQSDLRESFAAYGPVGSVYIVVDDSDGRSKSLGFIEMSWQAHAVAAVQGLNGSELKGRPMDVGRARPQSDGGSRGNPPRGWEVVGGGRSH